MVDRSGDTMTRRSFLKTGAGALVGAGELAFLARLAPVSAADLLVDPEIVRFDPAIEPLVRLLEDTPRGRLLEEVGARVRKGLAYRELLTALLLAGIRNVQPRPTVGFKFHAVLVVHSAHLVARSAPESDRWLPLLWAVDHFKQAQAADVHENDWTMRAVNPARVPSKAQAARAFVAAMEAWDEAAADAAAAGLARHLDPHDVFELLARYAARDIRSIGHKAIHVANAWRALDTIGWQHAEPVLRSVAYALLAREGSDPLKGDDGVDRPWRRNLERLDRVRPGWSNGTADSGATVEMLATLRDGTDDETAERVLSMLGRKVSPASIWDGVMCGATELLMRNPGILSLHAVTTTNAIRFLYERSASDETRRLLLLQNASFLPFFRGGGSIARIDQLSPLELAASGDRAIEDICAVIGRDNAVAARKVLGYLARHPDPRALLDAANRLVFLKGNDSHDYKFSAAVLEDYGNLSPAWRTRHLAASVFWLNGSGAPDNQLIARARGALAGRTTGPPA
jgi:hypothetical protein